MIPDPAHKDSPDMLAHALAAAELGFAVCPGVVPEYALVLVRHIGFKNPFSIGHYHRATSDERTIRRWFTRFPKANIIIRTGRVSNLVVLDFDFQYGGRPTWERMRTQLPKTLRVNTPNGIHLYYRYPEGIEIPTSIRQVEVGLDIISEMGDVVAPPSRHLQGQRYRFEDPDAPMSDLPKELARRCAEVTPQPFWHPHNLGYAAALRDGINLSYAHAVTVPNLLRRYLRGE